MDNWVVRKLFASNPGADGTAGRKIFYPPEIALQTGYDYIFFGTGDRDNPRSTGVVNRFYGIKDTNPANGFSTVTESAPLTDQTGITSTDHTPLNGPGWYIRLVAGADEKCLAPPVLFNKYVLFNTFLPNNAACDIGGSARQYAADYLTGLYTRFILGNGIPTEAVVVVRAGDSTAFVGAGGGVVNLKDLVPDPGGPNNEDPDLIDKIFDFNKGIRPISWREVF